MKRTADSRYCLTRYFYAIARLSDIESGFIYLPSIVVFKFIFSKWCNIHNYKIRKPQYHLGRDLSPLLRSPKAINMMNCLTRFWLPRSRSPILVIDYIYFSSVVILDFIWYVEIRPRSLKTSCDNLKNTKSDLIINFFIFKHFSSSEFLSILLLSDSDELFYVKVF